MHYPEWLKVSVDISESFSSVGNIVTDMGLKTVCEEAKCPNLIECFNNRTATFLIMGDICTRSCRFCAIKKGIPQILNLLEPNQVAFAVKELKLKYVVITSVTRDDLADGGAAHYLACVERIREENGDIDIELLIPDFSGNRESINAVVACSPKVINHNIETVKRLYAQVRSGASYEQSLNLLEYIKTTAPHIYTKSGLMLGLGEKDEEVIETLVDLRSKRCDYLTIGQYLAPTKKHIPVVNYIEPECFERYKILAFKLGFSGVAAGPLVRSSYLASHLIKLGLLSKPSFRSN